MEKIVTQDVYLPVDEKSEYAVHRTKGSWSTIGHVQKFSNMVVLTKEAAIELCETVMKLQDSVTGRTAQEWDDCKLARTEYLTQLFGEGK